MTPDYVLGMIAGSVISGVLAYWKGRDDGFAEAKDIYDR